jgi:hypothetical protein
VLLLFAFAAVAFAGLLSSLQALISNNVVSTRI